MTLPSLTFTEKPSLAVTSTGANLVGLFLTKDNTFYVNVNASANGVYQLNTTTPFTTPNKVGVLVPNPMGTNMLCTYGSQYDPKSDTFVTCKTGIVEEYDTKGVLIRSADWSSVIGTNTAQGVILGYEAESYFYILSKATYRLYRCNRDLSELPVFVRDFTLNTNFKANQTPNGFFNNLYIYMLTYNSGYKILRTNIATGAVTEITLVNPPTQGTNVGFLALGVYKGRVVTTVATHQLAGPLIAIYDIDDESAMYFLIKDGDELKSYSDTGYTRNVCVGGAVISSTGYEPGHPNVDAFDGILSTYWGSNEVGLNVRGNAFIGYDFESVPRHIRRIEITKADDIRNTPDFIKVQYSDDGATWIDAMPTVTMTKDTGVQVIDVPASARARRWRLLAYEVLETGKTWRVRDVKMYERNLAGWYVVGVAPAIPEMFRINGLGSIDFMTHELMTYLNNPKFEVQAYVERARTNIPTLDMNAVPHPRVVYPIGDIPLASVEKIEKFTITGTEKDAGKIRIILSVDKGVRWLTWDFAHDKWIGIDDKNLDAVRTGGMTIDIFNQRVSAEWMALQSETIRFAYYLEQQEETDEASSEILTMTADMLGIWEKAKEKDYSYGYPRNDRLTIRFFTDGDYKINYTTY